MLGCLGVALASGMYVANVLCTSDTAEGTPKEAPPPPAAAKNAAVVVPPGRGVRRAPPTNVDVSATSGPPFTRVTGGQVLVEPALAAASQADERSSTPSASSSAANEVASFNLHREHEEDGGPTATFADSAAVAVRHGSSDEKEEERLETLGCIPCDAMFRKVEETEFGTNVQNVTVQVGSGGGVGLSVASSTSYCRRLIFSFKAFFHDFVGVPVCPLWSYSLVQCLNPRLWCLLIAHYFRSSWRILRFLSPRRSQTYLRLLRAKLCIHSPLRRRVWFLP